VHALTLTELIIQYFISECTISGTVLNYMMVYAQMSVFFHDLLDLSSLITVL